MESAAVSSDFELSVMELSPPSPPPSGPSSTPPPSSPSGACHSGRRENMLSSINLQNCPDARPQSTEEPKTEDCGQMCPDLSR
uniref:Uncharacterized protein n=1 Tax=Knipowitschia caucasica TaxID=637954 RepID=A0AAV2LB61_KNICA